MTMISVLVLACYILASASAQDPYSPGPHNVTYIEEGNVLTIGLKENLAVWSPVEAGEYPIMFFLSGFSDLVPSSLYGDVMSHVASHGFVVVGLWKIIGNVAPGDDVPWILQSIDWCKTNLETELKKEGVSEDMTINYNYTFGFTNSAGAPVLLDLIKRTGCEDFKGIFHVSPVDGPPYKVTINETVFNFDIPQVILGTGLDPVPGNLSQPCAPERISNKVIYDMVHPDSPRWFINATEYGHADIMNQGVVNANDAIGFCAYDPDNTDEDLDDYRNFVAAETVSFLKAFLEPNCADYFTFLEDQSEMIVETNIEFVRPTPGCQLAYCKWFPEA